VTQGITEVRFVDASTGWYAARFGTIATSTDGGASWWFQDSRTTSHLNDIMFVSDRTGWIVGQDGTILKTTTGGRLD
jgi:photosystem II stability/assembly factor-like uncharacterized protein